MRRPRYVEVRSLNDTLMLLLTGAIAGTAAGVYLGRRYGSVGALVDDVRHRLRDAWDSWSEVDELEPAGELEGEVEGELEGELADEFEDEFEGDFEDELLEEGEEHALPDEEALDELDADGEAGEARALADDGLDEPFDELEPIAAGDELPRRREADVSDIPSIEPARSSLEAKVLEGFEGDEVLGRRAIDISAVGEGVIELTGWVRSGEEAARAAALARAVAGVEMVLNRITVRSPEELADEADDVHEPDAGAPDAGRASRPTATPPLGVVPRSPPEGRAP